MKKTTFIALALLLIAGVTNAQTRLGIKAGANISSLSTDASSIIDQVKGSTNYQFGVVLQTHVLGLILQPEVLYSVKGGQFNNSIVSDLFSESDMKWKSQNIEVPLNIQLGFGLPFARAFIQGGPYVSFMTGALINGSSKQYEDVKDYVNNFDYGVGAGAGVELMGIQLSFKYDWGLSKLGKEEMLAGQNMNPFNELQNRNLSISLAYIF